MGTVSCWNQQLHPDSNESLSCCFSTWDDSVHSWSCSAGFKNQLDIICLLFSNLYHQQCLLLHFHRGTEQSLSVGLRCSETPAKKWVRDVTPLWNQANPENRKSPTSSASISPPSFIAHLFCNEIFFFWEKGSLLLMIMKSAMPFSPPASPQISVWLPAASGIHTQPGLITWGWHLSYWTRWEKQLPVSGISSRRSASVFKLSGLKLSWTFPGFEF